MELWVPLTIAAAFCQNLRSALQKRLSPSLGAWGATAARFVFAAPLTLALLAGVALSLAGPLPVPGPDFALFALIGGLAQILATGLLLHLFAFRNFAVATAYTKTETVQTALFGIVLLNEHLSLLSALAILVSLSGVLVMSLPASAATWRLRDLVDRAALMGVASGGLFGVSAVSYRAASLSLPSGDVLTRAAVTLAAVTTFQAVVMLVFLAWRRGRGETKATPGRLFASWRISAFVGLTGMLASLFWFSAFTLQNAALVRTLGQIEVVFMFAASILMFGEKIRAREVLGVILVSAGIAGLALG